MEALAKQRSQGVSQHIADRKNHLVITKQDDSQEADGDIRHGIHEANNPAVGGTLASIGIWAARRPSAVGDAERFRERQIGAVRTSLRDRVSGQLRVDNAI